LVAVLWIVALLSVIAISLVASRRSDGQLTHNLTALAKAESLADGGVNRAIAMLLDPRPDAHWRVDGMCYAFALANTEVTVSVEDEQGKIDLNTAPDELLTGLFAATGLSREESATLVDRIGDWRDPDDLHRLHGAELEDYRSAGYGYGPRNGPFESVDELRLVIGVTNALFERLAPSLTVFSQAASVNPYTAPRDVLLALPGMDAEKADALIKLRSGARDPDAAQTGSPVSGMSVTAISAGRAFMVRATGRASDGIEFHREAVVRLSGDPRRPSWLHTWSEGKRSCREDSAKPSAIAESR
jgi:general secretion pathway protein K